MQLQFLEAQADSNLKVDSAAKTMMQQFFRSKNQINTPRWSQLLPTISTLILLILTTSLVYWQVAGNDFINYDDPLYITNNPHVRQGITADNLVWALTAKVAANWHPLTLISHMLDMQLFGLNPGLHHLTSLILHVLNTLLLFFVFKCLTGKIGPSSFIAFFFALHPMHVESVVWIAERKDVLSTFFGLLTIGSYIHYSRQPGLLRYLSVSLFLCLGLMAKPMLVTLPFILLLIDLWPLNRVVMPVSADTLFSIFRKNRRLIIEKIPLFALILISSWITYQVQDSSGAVKMLQNFPLQTRIQNAFVSYATYIQKLAFPFDLSIFYPYAATFSVWHLIVALFLILLVSIIAVKNISSTPWVCVGWFWYIGSLVPVIGFVQIGGQAMADRYTYIPSIGLSILIAWGIPKLLYRLNRRKEILAVLGFFFFAAISCLTWQNIRYWQNSRTLFEHALRVTKNNFIAHTSLGAELFQLKELDKAAFHFKAALKIEPNYKDAHNNLGAILMQKGDPEKAAYHFARAVQLFPSSTFCRNLAIALDQQGKTEESLRFYLEALRFEPNHQYTSVRFLQALNKAVNPDLALHYVATAMKSYPDSPAMHNYLGLAFLKARKFDAAIQSFTQALALEPNNIAVKKQLKKTIQYKTAFNRVVVDFKQKILRSPRNAALCFQFGKFYQKNFMWDQAIAIHQKAISIQPDFFPALNSLAGIHAILGNYRLSLSYYKKMLLLRPDISEIYYNISCIYARQKKVERSIYWLTSAINKGYNNWSNIKKDKDLDNIRQAINVSKLIEAYSESVAVKTKKPDPSRSQALSS